MPSTRNKLAVVVAAVAATGVVITTGTGANANTNQNSTLPQDLANAVSTKQMMRHLTAFQRISDMTGGKRAASTEGHIKSAEYVESKLKDAGYNVTRQEFPFTYSETLAERLTVSGSNVPVTIMSYSPSTAEGGVTAQTAAVPADATPGCEATDFEGVALTGKIALIKRGGCTFYTKQELASKAGAVATIVYNNTTGPLNGTLGQVGQIPTGGVTQADGEALVANAGQEVNLELRALMEERTTFNVIAETVTGAKDNVVMAGSHLDSVAAGPGINDNGSGSAALLNTALALGGKPKVNNAVRFAFWGAEEFGLIGSEYYVEQLSFEQKLDIALYLNFDMIASPNAGYFAYDGDDSDGIGAGPGPEGSAAIEKALASYIEGKGTPVEGTDFTGRSDYGPFIAVGIPAGGLFTGAEVTMTEAQATKWGGKAGVAYDKCYHQACDTLSNINRTALDRNGDAVAYVIGSYAISTEPVNGIEPGARKAAKVEAAERASQKVYVNKDARNQHGHNHSSCYKVAA